MPMSSRKMETSQLGTTNTPFVNPVLDRLGFWRGLERVLVPLFGAPRREDLVKYRWYRP